LQKLIRVGTNFDKVVVVLGVDKGKSSSNPQASSQISLSNCRFNYSITIMSKQRVSPISGKYRKMRRSMYGIENSENLSILRHASKVPVNGDGEWRSTSGENAGKENKDSESDSALVRIWALSLGNNFAKLCARIIRVAGLPVGIR
jgi:hypothetical protein